MADYKSTKSECYRVTVGFCPRNQNVKRVAVDFYYQIVSDKIDLVQRTQFEKMK